MHAFTDDPYRNLEDHAHAQPWIMEQNQRTAAALNNDARFAPLSAAILQASQDARQIPYFAEHQGWLYHFYQDTAHPRGLYRRTTRLSYQSEHPEWQVVFNLDELAELEQVDWQLAEISHCILQPNLCLLSLNVGGSDASVCREYDLAQHCFPVDGFAFEYGKNQIHWRDADSVFVCPAWDESQLTQSGYSCEVWRLNRGQTWEEAQSLAVFPADCVRVSAWRFLDGDHTAFDMIEASVTLYKKAYYHLATDGTLTLLPLPAQAELMAYSHGDLLVKLAQDWCRKTEFYPAGSLLAIACDALTAQFGRIQRLVTPTARQTVQTLEASLNTLVVTTLDCVKSGVLTFAWQMDGWQAFANHLPLTGVIELVDQPWQSDVLYYNFSDFLTPAALYCIDLQPGAQPELLRQQPAAFDANEFTAAQYFAMAKDGTAIPYFVVHAKKYLKDGSAPTLLYGYGGFQVPLLPYYVDHFGPHWLAKGGIFVVANIRGGGEFGPAWHQAAQGRQRQVSFDDFIAIAEDLIAQGWTSPRRLAIEGGSNGGLLVGACLTQRPELFNAVVCEVPLLDMLRYTELHAGASWIAEYGDPQQVEDWAALAAYSPYHHISHATVQRYPKVLLTTHRQDDRVHPAHARKMAAKMQALGHEVLFYENAQGGHSGASNPAQTAADLARILVFLYQQLMDN